MPDAAMPPVPPINRTEVDGVRTLWVDEPGPMIATLAFRVGRSDEPTPMSGITHIVEHLALAGLGVQDYDHNGFVDGQQTVFTSIGRPDEVKTFLEEVVRGLTQPPLDRLLLERRILREERSQRGPSIGGAVRWYRFGYAGQGRALGPGDDELALDWLGPGPVEAWMRRWFTRQNAILWLTGPVPDGLRLELPDGEPAPTPDITPIPGVTFPTHLAWDGPAATLGYVAQRTSAIHIASSIAHRRARQRLRFDQGLVYDVELDYEPLAPTVAHVMLGASCPDERIRQVVDGLLGIVRELATDGPTQGELEQELSGYLRQYEDRDGRIALLASTAFDTLWGGPARTAEQLLDERRAVDPATARDALATALDTMLVMANCEAVPKLEQYPAWSTSRVDGREYAPAGFFLPGRKPKERLTVGPEGVTVAVTPGEWLTVRYADCVAAIHEGPAVRTLLGRDGMRVGIVAEGWKDGTKAIEEVDRAIPAELVACDEHGIGGLEDPVQDEPAA
jgi:predicted Zn-dependent peptidase